MATQEAISSEQNITLGDGSVVKIPMKDGVPDWEAGFKQVSEMKVNASQAVVREREEKERLAAERQQLLDAARPKPVQPKTGEFNNQKYYDMLNTDPIAAQNYLDAHRFGLETPEQVPVVFQSMRQDVTNLNQRTVTAEFLAQHIDDFPQDAKAAHALSDRVRQLCFNEGMPLTVRTMNLAYGELINEGTLKPVEPNTETEVERPNPSLVGAGGGVPDDLSSAESWDDKKLEAELKKRGLLK